MTRFTCRLLATVFCAILWLAAAGPALAQRSDHGTRSDPEGAPAAAEVNPATLEQYAFEVPYLDGDVTLSFEELVQGDVPFVLFWWLADCPICHLQMPYVQQLQNFIDQDQLRLRVVGINVDTTPEECVEYLKDTELSFEMLYDRRARETNEPFQIEELGCPLVYVFDNNGELVETYTGFHAGIVRMILKQLDIPIPEELDD